jgi:glucuronate isomerase
MKKFLDENFLLQSDTAELLYHEYAKNMPIIDYHCHLPPADIANNTVFENISQAWLYGDHYKWRAMRTNGIEENYITGNQSDWEKFNKWAETVPNTLRNPLYHWTHLELQRYFDISEVLNPTSARAIFDQSSAMLNTKEFSVRNLLKKMNVKLVCTTDDPTDSLEFHKKLKEDATDEVLMVPAFRPDNAMNVTDTTVFLSYVAKLEKVCNVSISNFSDFIQALKNRHDYFDSMGCKVSDHGLEEIYADEYSDGEIDLIFEKLLKGLALDIVSQRKFKSAMLVYFAEWDCEKGWIQQFHLGAIRNNNTRMLQKLGPDTGWDSMGSFNHGKPLSTFLNNLDKSNNLAKTILYNLNPADNEMMATMIGNFNDGSLPGKMQWGSAWWFLDQKDGIIKHLDVLSNMGLLSRFVGMLTDSRSFLSFPRHEYFRRILCNLLGNEIENGELPNDIPWVGKVVQDICYHNNKNYFNWPVA